MFTFISSGLANTFLEHRQNFVSAIEKKKQKKNRKIGFGSSEASFTNLQLAARQPRKKFHQ